MLAVGVRICVVSKHLVKGFRSGGQERKETHGGEQDPHTEPVAQRLQRHNWRLSNKFMHFTNTASPLSLCLRDLAQFLKNFRILY